MRSPTGLFRERLMPSGLTPFTFERISSKRVTFESKFSFRKPIDSCESREWPVCAFSPKIFPSVGAAVLRPLDGLWRAQWQ